MTNFQRAGAGVAALLAIISTSRASFAFACNDPSLPNPIHVVGGSAPLPIFAKLATALGNLSPAMTLIYQSGAACSGVNAIVTPPANGLSGNASYWNSAGVQETCSFPSPGPAADLGVSGTYATSCPGVSVLPAGVGDFLGPVEAFDFVVPSQSTQASISAQAAYFIFGFGAGSSLPSYPVSPWTVASNIFTRNDLSSEAMSLSLALRVPLTDLANTTVFTDGQSSTQIVLDLSSLNATANHDAGLGFVTNGIAEEVAANTVSVLAYQDYGQSCGWTPSSTPTALDQINVRAGLYPLWANIHLVANVNSSKVPSNPMAAQVIGWYEDTVAPPTGVDIDGMTISSGDVPDCAMEVRRTSDAGPLIPYAPAEPCGCYFEAKATGSTTCTSCASSATCTATAPNCRKGYCEVN